MGLAVKPAKTREQIEHDALSGLKRAEQELYAAPPEARGPARERFLEALEQYNQVVLFRMEPKEP